MVFEGNDFIYNHFSDGNFSFIAINLKGHDLFCPQDYSVSHVMNGHKSVVSTLAVCNGVLYSGSWDGTVRLWSLSDHSPLAVLGEDAPGNVTSVLSLAACGDALVVAHENGCMKVIYFPKS